MRWSKAADFELILYEPGDWEHLLEQVTNVL